jgi:hypothetical protein
MQQSEDEKEWRSNMQQKSKLLFCLHFSFYGNLLHMLCISECRKKWTSKFVYASFTKLGNSGERD